MSLDKDVKKLVIILAILLIVLAGFIFLKYEKAKKESLVYTGVNGEEYFFQKEILGGNTTFYYIYVYVKNMEYVYPFRYYPTDLESIPLDVNLKSDLLSKNFIYVTQNLETTEKTEQQSFLGVIEVVKILGMANDGIYKKLVKSAFIEPYKNETVADCSDVSDLTGVIYFKLGNEDKIYSEDGCVIVEGKDTDGLIKSSEKFAYHLLGVF